MLLIRCPWCGERDESEFRYRGDARAQRPQGADMRAFVDHVYLRDNPAGLHEEWWQHVGGCRRTLKALRDTATHSIAATAWPEEMWPDGSGTLAV
jgi:sarcosine oxidase subunit delta